MIRLFWVDLEVDDHELARHRASLWPEEINRADRFRFERDRRRFVARRGLLRAVLGRHMGCPPSSLDLRADRWGKPFLAPSDPLLSFNASHSGSVAVVAVADGRPVGVDVEVTRPDPCDVEVARHFFSAVEITALLASPRSDFATSFLRIWTRKEAWVKAKGQGLSIPLDSFDVSLGPGDARLIAVRGPAGECARWTMADVSGRYFGVDIVACVTATGADWQVSSETWHSGQPKAMCSYTSGGKAAWNETTHRTAPCA